MPRFSRAAEGDVIANPRAYIISLIRSFLGSRSFLIKPDKPASRSPINNSLLTALDRLGSDLANLKSFVSQNVSQGFPTSSNNNSSSPTIVVQQIGATNSTLLGTSLTLGNTTYSAGSILASGSSTFTINPNNSSGTVAVSGNLTVSGTATWTNASFKGKTVSLGSLASAQYLYAQTGSAASPSFSFTQDQDTGMWRPAANTLAFSTLGAEAMRINSAGNIGIGTTSPLTKLQITGTASASHFLTNGNIQIGNGSSTSYSRFGSGTSKDGLGSSGVLVSGNLEIGSSLSATGLRIDGTITAHQFLKGNGQGNAWLRFTKNTDPANNANAGAQIIWANNGSHDISFKSAIYNYTHCIGIDDIGAFMGSGKIGNGVCGAASSIRLMLYHDGTALPNTSTILASASGNVDVTIRSTDSPSNHAQFTLRSAGSHDRLDFLNNTNVLMSLASTDYLAIGNTGFKTMFSLTNGTASVSKGVFDTAINVALNNVATVGYNRFGVNTTTHGLSGGSDLLISGNNEVDASTALDGQLILKNTLNTQNIASISAPSLTTGNLFNIQTPPSSSFKGNIFLAKDTNNVTVFAVRASGQIQARSGIFSHGSTTNCTSSGSPAGACIDYAEDMPLNSSKLQGVSGRSQMPKPGDIVTIDPTSDTFAVMKAITSYDKNIIGIVSTNPAITIGTSVRQGDYAKNSPEGSVPVALAGRVPVNFSNENGDVKPGDYLTSSPTKPGYAMKATKRGRAIGIALSAAASAKEDGTPAQALVLINMHEAGSEVDANGAVADFSGGASILETKYGPIHVATLFGAVASYLKDAMGITLEQGMLKVAKVLTQTIITSNSQTQYLKVRTGVTLHNRGDNQTYCIKVIKGQLTVNKGSCQLTQAN